MSDKTPKEEFKFPKAKVRLQIEDKIIDAEVESFDFNFSTPLIPVDPNWPDGFEENVPVFSELIEVVDVPERSEFPAPILHIVLSGSLDDFIGEIADKLLED